MDLLPTFLKLAGRRVLVVGGGPVAASKLDALSRAGADITVVAPAVHASIAARPDVRVEARPYAAPDLDGIWFVVAAATPQVNAEVARDAERRGLFVNAVDDPANASAYLGGVVRRADVTIAISTSGAAPALAGVLREAIDALLPIDLDRWSACARDLRIEWKRTGLPMSERRPQLIEALKGLYP
ncbi:MAG TPA: bifunctional precorrin-2 dehydrogenase/sirohydrochlorin ferrochelatase [Vicinamibacterales bacterium]|nr:bifunctional precorrin-2 dehydrogenase/sirohydrochlorin ferrochelatase [Vicinamibacterales bacterium]